MTELYSLLNWAKSEGFEVRQIAIELHRHALEYEPGSYFRLHAKNLDFVCGWCYAIADQTGLDDSQIVAIIREEILPLIRLKNVG